MHSASVQSDDVDSRESHSDIFLRVAMSVLPVTAVLTYQMDAIWQLHFRTMYAGLASTILHIFYFLQFYTHLQCRSATVTLIYTCVYQLIIWIFKVGFPQ
jgi:heme/copper-type cytochrome/quinol oxidase subunit 4